MEEKTTIKKDFDPKALIWPLVILLVVAGVIWGIYNYSTQNKSAAPTVEISTPVEGGTVDANTIEIQGKTNNKNTVTVNGAEVDVAKDGNFSSEVALVEGENSIMVTVFGRNGQKVEKTLTVVRETSVTGTNPVSGVNLADSGPESLWIPEASLLALAGAGYYGTRKKLLKAIKK